MSETRGAPRVCVPWLARTDEQPTEIDMTEYKVRKVRGKWRVYAVTRAAWGRVIHTQLGAYTKPESAEVACRFFVLREASR